MSTAREWSACNRAASQTRPLADQLAPGRIVVMNWNQQSRPAPLVLVLSWTSPILLPTNFIPVNESRLRWLRLFWLDIINYKICLDRSISQKESSLHLTQLFLHALNMLFVAPPRSIVIKCLRFKTKETILRKARQKKGFTWQENRINLDHDYPPLILKKRREYTEIRKILKENFSISFKILKENWNWRSSVPDPLPCQAARETRGRNQNLRDSRGGIRGPAEKRLRCDNHHHTSGDAHGAGAAALLDESGQTSKEGPSRPGSEKKKLRAFRRSSPTPSGTGRI